jgi:hypothetical protein
MIPFQGGTNEEVVNKMYKDLNAKGKAEHLKVYWYTAKDQLKPMNAAEKKRNCHGAFFLPSSNHSSPQLDLIRSDTNFLIIYQSNS